MQNLPYDTRYQYDTNALPPVSPAEFDAFATEIPSADRKRQRTGTTSSMTSTTSSGGGSVITGDGTGPNGVSAAAAAAAAVNAKRLSRARSDSAPQGYGIGGTWSPAASRPRSGSGLAPRVGTGARRDDLLVNISGSRGTGSGCTQGSAGASSLLNVSPVNKVSQGH